jgi:hypothetical protein
MYKNGLHFPIFYFFLFDNIIINNLYDITKLKDHFFQYSEDETKSSIIDNINASKGFEIFPFILNYFDYFIQSSIKFKKENITSNFIDRVKFDLLIKTYKIDFQQIEISLIEIDRIGKIDKTQFYTELYKLLYKNFVFKLSSIINYSDFEVSKLYLDFNADFKKFEEYSIELEERRPFQIKNYDYKILYTKSFYKSFNTRNINEILHKIDVIKCHSDKEILITFRKLIKNTIIINNGVNSRTRNKLFKPIFKEVNSAIKGKIYYEHSRNSLTREVKKFFADN